MLRHGAPRETHDVVLVIADLRSGGAQRVLTALSNAWAARGIKPMVLTLSSKHDDFFRLSPQVSRRALDAIGPSANAGAAVMANWRRLRRLRHAIVESGAPTVVAFVGTVNILTILASIGLGLRVIVSERNDPDRQSLGVIWDLLRRLVYRWASVVTVNTQGGAAALRRYVPRRKIAFLPNPVVRAANKPKTPRTEKIVLSVGRVSFQKAHDVLIRAFAILAAAEPDWRLQIIGTGPREAELKREVVRLGLGAQIEWLGIVADPGPYYRAAAVFALPSRYEGMPNALIEAMDYGLPAIVTDASPGPLEYVTDGVSGLVVPADDSQALGDALIRLATDAPLRSRLGRAAEKRIAAIDPNQAIDDWIDVLGLPGHAAAKDAKAGRTRPSLEGEPGA